MYANLEAIILGTYIITYLLNNLYNNLVCRYRTTNVNHNYRCDLRFYVACALSRSKEPWLMDLAQIVYSSFVSSYFMHFRL